MNRRRRTLMPCFLILINCSISVSAASDDPARLLDIQIAAPQRNHILGEPVVIFLELANTSGEAVPLFFRDNEDFQDARFRFELRHADSTSSTLLDTDTYYRHVLDTPTVAPGRKWRCKKLLLLAGGPKRTGGERDLLSPGQYRLVAQVLVMSQRTGEHMICSNTVSLSIVEPRGQDAEALKLLARSPAAAQAFFIAGRQSRKLEPPEGIQDMLEQYPDSTYAPYARGRVILECAHYHWQQRSAWSSRGGPPDSQPSAIRYTPERVISKGLAFVQEFPQMPLSDEILLYCGRMHQLLRQEDQARQLLERIPAEYPDSDIREIAEKRLAAWRSPRDRGSRPAE